MNVFLDTSCLFKLYHKENDTQKLIDALSENSVTKIFLSDLAKIEFTSTIWKKVRTNELTENQRKTVWARFESDFVHYKFIEVNKNITESAKVLKMAMVNKDLGH